MQSLCTEAAGPNVAKIAVPVGAGGWSTPVDSARPTYGEVLDREVGGA
jgi:hypothetical protein